MTFGGHLPYAVFTGALGDNATGGYHPAHAEVGNGVVTLWVAAPQGWVQYFSVPAPEVVVASAAQRITLEVHGRKYPILADPGAVNRALGLGVTGLAASAFDRPGLGVAADVGRGVDQVSAARSSPPAADRSSSRRPRSPAHVSPASGTARSRRSGAAVRSWSSSSPCSWPFS